MKQKLMSFLYNCNDTLKELNQYLYNNPEKSYKEFKAYSYIIKLLKSYNFEIKEKFLDIDTSFYASKGSGHPKICFLCEYDCVPSGEHLTGHNLLTTTSIGAAITLGNIIDEIGGSIIVIGCPGEYLGGTKPIMAKQGVFEDIDTILMAHPDVATYESGSSSAIIPLSIKFTGSSGLSFLNQGRYNSLDGILLTFNILNSMLKGFPKDVEINSILSQGGYTPLLLPIESEAKFYIRGKNMSIVSLVEDKIREIAASVSKLLNIDCTFSLYELCNEELLTNRLLNRIFSHNLKESGIIEIDSAKDVPSGLSVGIVSKKVPCIHPFFSIIKECEILYGTKEFADATITPFALEQSLKASLALAYTAYDLITSDTLLQEVKTEFYNSIE